MAEKYNLCLKPIYIPLQRETTRPPTQAIHVADANMLVTEKPCGPNATPQRETIMPNANLNNAQREPIMPNLSPNGIMVRVGHVHFMLFVSI